MVISSLYTSSGTKLRQITQEGSNITSMTDYCGNIIYTDSSLAFILMPEGRITINQSANNQSANIKSDSSFIYGFADLNIEYFINDHLGNTRTIVSDSGKVLESAALISQRADLVFGMQINELSYSSAEPQNRYKYNGKEISKEFGLDWYEYGFRMYDPQIARFPSLDPKTDEFAFVSPYNYAENEPIAHIDLWGLQKADPPRLKITATGAITANSVSSNMTTLGNKTGFAMNSGKQDFFRFSTEYNTDVGFIPPKNVTNNDLSFGVSFGDGIGITYERVESIDGTTDKGEHLIIHTGLVEIDIDESANDEGTKIRNYSLALTVGAEASIIYGAETNIKATLFLFSEEIKPSLTIDQMLEKGWTIPAEAIEWNQQQKSNPIYNNKSN